MTRLARETESGVPPNPFVKAATEARETELVIAAQTGSKNAFEELQKLHRDRLYRTVVSITRNREDAEDVLQDTFLRAYLAFHAMFNTECGESCTSTMLVECVQQFEGGRVIRHEPTHWIPRYRRYLRPIDCGPHFCLNDNRVPNLNDHGCALTLS